MKRKTTKQASGTRDVYVQRPLILDTHIVEYVEEVRDTLGERVITLEPHNIALMLFKASRLREFHCLPENTDLKQLTDTINDHLMAQPEIELCVDTNKGGLFVIEQRNLLCLSLQNSESKLDFAVHQAVTALEDALGSRIEQDHKGHVSTHERGYLRNSLQDYLVLGEILPENCYSPAEYNRLIKDPVRYIDDLAEYRTLILPEIVCFGAMELALRQRQDLLAHTSLH